MSSPKIILTASFIALLGLSGCSNTFEGAGRDIEGAGEWIQNTF